MKTVKRIIENVDTDFIRSKLMQLKERKETTHK